MEKNFAESNITITPASIPVKINAFFILQLCPNEETDEEWEDLLDENIDSITYHSSKSFPACVNKRKKKKRSAAVKPPKPLLLLEMIQKILTEQRYILKLKTKEPIRT